MAVAEVARLARLFAERLAWLEANPEDPALFERAERVAETGRRLGAAGDTLLAGLAEPECVEVASLLGGLLP